MKRIIILFSILVFALVSCQEDNNQVLTDSGTVVDYAGAGDCGIVIELDGGSKIQPIYYPEGFVFSQGQRVLVEYVEMSEVKNGCDRGIPCEINYVEELACAPYVDLYFANYDSLARDPVHLHDAFMDGTCLYLKISYSGGCQEHTIDLARMHPWTASSSTIPTFEIRHDASDDMCEAWITHELRYDLSSLIEEGKNEFVLTAKLLNDKVYNKIFEIN
jgi:hypothetical protein